jgi:hypothetical protein
MRAAYLILLAILVTTYACALNEIKKKSSRLTPLLGWMIGLGFFLIIPLSAVTLHGGYRAPQAYEINGWGDVDLSNLSSLKPFIVIWLSVMSACAVAYFCCPTTLPDWVADWPAIRRKLERSILITMIIGVIGWLAMIYAVGGLEAFLISHWYNRIADLVEQHGTGFVLFDHITQANDIVFTGAAALYTSLGLRNRDTRWPFTLFIAAFLLIAMAMTGNRIYIALYLLSFLTSAWLFNRKRIIGLILVISPILAIFFSSWAAVRHDLTGVPDSMSNYVADYNPRNNALTAIMDATEGTDVTLLMHMINDFGNRLPYLYGGTYGRIFTFFLPKRIYPSRPRDFTTLTAGIYEPGGTTSLGSTALGEAFANFGFFGILALPMWTWLGCRFPIGGHQGKAFDLVSPVAFIMFIWFARGTLAESALLLVGALMLIYLLRLAPRFEIPRGQSARQALN